MGHRTARQLACELARHPWWRAGAARLLEGPQGPAGTCQLTRQLARELLVLPPGRQTNGDHTPAVLASGVSVLEPSEACHDSWHGTSRQLAHGPTQLRSSQDAIQLAPKEAFPLSSHSPPLPPQAGHAAIPGFVHTWAHRQTASTHTHPGSYCSLVHHRSSWPHTGHGTGPPTHPLVNKHPHPRPPLTRNLTTQILKLRPSLGTKNPNPGNSNPNPRGLHRPSPPLHDRDFLRDPPAPGPAPAFLGGAAPSFLPGFAPGFVPGTATGFAPGAAVSFAPGFATGTGSGRKQEGRGPGDVGAGDPSRQGKMVAVQIQATHGAVRAFHVAMKKSELAHETGLALRDLRVVDPTFSNQIPAIIARPRAIVMSLAHVKVVIRADSVLVFNLGSERVRRRVVPRLLARIHHAFGGAYSDAHSRADSDTHRRADSDTHSRADSDTHDSSYSDTHSGASSGPYSDTSGTGRLGSGASREAATGIGPESGTGAKGGARIGPGSRSNVGERPGASAESGVPVEGGLEGGEERVREREGERELEGEGEGEGDGERERDGFPCAPCEEIVQEARSIEWDGLPAACLEKPDKGGVDERGRGGGLGGGGGEERRGEVKEYVEEILDLEAQRQKDVFSGGFEFERRAGAASEEEKVKECLEGIQKVDPELLHSDAALSAPAYSDTHPSGTPYSETDQGVAATRTSDLPHSAFAPEGGPTPSPPPGSPFSEFQAGPAGTGAHTAGRGGAPGGPTRGMEGSEKVAAGPAPIPFELVVLEGLLDEVDATIQAKFSTVGPQVLAVVKECIGDSRAYELTSEGQQKFLHAKNRMLRLEKGIKQVTEAIAEVLANDEDMAEMYLTRKAHSGPSEEHSEVEELLEDYLKRIEQVESEVETMNLTVDATAQYMATALDSARNQLIRLDLLVNMATCSLAVGGTLAAVFGMNLTSSLEDSTTAFFVVSGSVGAASTLIFMTLVRYARRHGIL